MCPRKAPSPDFFGVTVTKDVRNTDEMCSLVQSMVQFTELDEARVSTTRILESIFRDTGVYYQRIGGYIIWDWSSRDVAYGYMYHCSGIIFQFRAPMRNAYNMITGAMDSFVEEEDLYTTLMNEVYSFTSRPYYGISSDRILLDVQPFEAPENPAYVLETIPAIRSNTRKLGFAEKELFGLDKYFQLIFRHDRSGYLKTSRKLKEIKKICEAGTGDGRYEIILRLTGLYRFPASVYVPAPNNHISIWFIECLTEMDTNKKHIAYRKTIKRMTGIDPKYLIDTWIEEREDSPSGFDIDSIPVLVQYTSPVQLAIEIIRGMYNDETPEAIVRHCLSLPSEIINLSFLTAEGETWKNCATDTFSRHLFYSDLDENVKNAIVIRHYPDNTHRAEFNIENILSN